MAEQDDVDAHVVPTDRLDLLRERLRARGRQGWHLVAVLPDAGDRRQGAGDRRDAPLTPVRERLSPGGGRRSGEDAGG